MNKNLTEIVCVIDRSGSMHSIRSDAIGGFNSFLDSQKQEAGEAKLTLVLFNHEYEQVHNGVAIQKVKPLNDATYVPAGMTALLDAVGRTIDDVGLRLSRMPEKERPSKVIMAILTDGLENASKDYTRDRIFDMIEHQRHKYNWEFVFLGANQDAIATARTLSIDAQDTVNFSATGKGIRDVYGSLSKRVSQTRRRK